MKIFAFYLPQFHEIPENNEWWGEGFTEWTNVKKATPLFNGHVQPRVPLGNKYYNLLDKETVKWQTSLMKQYGIDGMIYYHYYFLGKMLLEKPAENLLADSSINQPFFFCWANHSWNRSWRGSREVLLEQTYGTSEDWEKHFQYLLPFFKDNRYEKRANKPLFMTFSSHFDEAKDMFKYFDLRCKEEGFDGICLIETYHGNCTLEEFKANKISCSDLIFYREPSVTTLMYKHDPKNIMRRIRLKILKELRKKNLYKKPDVINGNKLMEYKIAHEPMGNGIAHGSFFAWDNTPRHGYRGYVITQVSEDLFAKYMGKIKDEEYLFINAWNEWAEGMMLEPTEENGHLFLDWVKRYRPV